MSAYCFSLRDAMLSAVYATAIPSVRTFKFGVVPI